MAARELNLSPRETRLLLLGDLTAMLGEFVRVYGGRDPEALNDNDIEAE